MLVSLRDSRGVPTRKLLQQEPPGGNPLVKKLKEWPSTIFKNVNDHQVYIHISSRLILHLIPVSLRAYTLKPRRKNTEEERVRAGGGGKWHCRLEGCANIETTEGAGWTIQR